MDNISGTLDAGEMANLDSDDPVRTSSEAGATRLDAVIGKDGRVRSVKSIGEDSPAAEAAGTAVRQWVYRPTLSNWEPVEVRTEIRVN